MAGAAQHQKQALTVGPFTGGLNNVSLSGEARDNELVDLVNMEVTVDGALTSRPSIQVIPGTTLPAANTLGWEVLGIYRISNSEWYLIVSQPSDTTNVNTVVKAYMNGIIGAGESVITIKTITGLHNRITAVCQFKDWVYFNVGPLATDTGFRWKKNVAVSNIVTMPKGNLMVSWKTRLWIAGTGDSDTGDTIRFSTIDSGGPKPEIWAAADTFDVAPGEGGFITAMIPSFNNLIVFKNDGTWRFSYPSKPAAGTIDKISGQVGASGKNAVVDFENYMYVYDQGRIYEMVNSNFSQVNRFVNFREDEFGVDAVAPDVELSIINRRLLVRYFNAMYSFNIDTKTWSQWRSYSGTPGRFYELPANSSDASPSQYVAASRGAEQSVSANMIEDSGFLDPDTNAARAAIVDGTVTFSNGNCTINSPVVGASMQFNTSGDLTDYNIPVSTSQQFNFSMELTGINIMSFVDVVWLLTNGSTTTTSSSSFVTPGSKSFNFTAPAGAIAARCAIRLSDDGIITFNNPSFTRISAQAPLNLMRLSDEYPDQAEALEFIDCQLQTKSYDYRTPGNFKRLFWAGIDVKTTRPVKTEIRPVSRTAPITWSQLDSYTWDQLEAGTWENPLSWLNTVTVVTNILDADSVPSENGRYFKKLGKSLRFRQISYTVKMSTLGNKPTGPAKFFTLTTYVATKQVVVDTST